MDNSLFWYKDAVIYELHIKAFKDGNGDGIGDFTGLLETLDYLQDLGVTAIWVLPFYPSPLRDDGYDIADYYSINTRYGNIKQFKQFLEEAHKRGLKVITELVINHTSDQHPWFQRARNAPKDSPERNYYVWSDDPKKYKDVRIIFQDFENSNWTWDAVAQQYYWHRFFYHQPDLNYDSELVQQEIFKIIDYWCDMGVDGFRLDAVPYLFERENTNGENLPQTHAFLKKLRKHIDEFYPNTVFLAEANMWPEDSASYFGNGDECHMNYHFPVMPRMYMALQMEDRYPVTDIFEQTPEIPANCQWAMFLRNHDELTLEMVTDDERDYMYKAYAKDPKARINLGIRHRLAPLLDNDRKKIELLNCLLFSLPGTPVIYYGDEIGMGDNFYLGDRDGVRTPMQWSADRNAGFSKANPQQLYLPLILDPEYHYEAVNVELQQQNTSSLFWYMKRMISMRKQYIAFGRGDMKFIDMNNAKVLAFTRTYEDETLLVVVNLSKFSQSAEALLDDYEGKTPVELFSKNRFPVIKKDEHYPFMLSSHSFYWFYLKPANLKIEEIESIPLITSSNWDDLLENSAKNQLENDVLPAYLLKSRWFVNKDKEIYSINIIDNTSLQAGDKKIYFLLLEVSYQSGLPENYFLPLALALDAQADKLSKGCPESVVAKLKVNNAEGLVYDALYTSELQLELLKQFSDINDNSQLTFRSKEEVKQYAQQHPDLKAKMYAYDKVNTSLVYDNAYILKLYRKIDLAINPDEEITKFLSEEKKFTHVPTPVATIDWNNKTGCFVLGMMLRMEENHGDAFSYIVERLNNFIERILAAKKETLYPEQLIGKLTSPASFEELPEELQTLIGSRGAEQAKILGERTAEMHLLLGSEQHRKEFVPEEFSLHYQRSLFSFMVSLVRETFSRLNMNMQNLPAGAQILATEINNKRRDILTLLKSIYSKKLDAQKIRIHGNFYLDKILLTNKDLLIQDFSGDPSYSYSARRLKRSPLVDVAGMVSALYYVAYESFVASSHTTSDDKQNLMPFANMWSYYITGFFLNAYKQKIDGSKLMPSNTEDFEMMVRTFLLQRAIYDLNYEMKTNPDRAIVSLQLIHSLLE